MNPLNSEFCELLAASGWSAAEAARQLEVTPGLISQYRSGATRPSAQMLRLFKLVLATENPAALKPAGGSAKYPPHRNEFGELNDKLIALKDSDPRAFATVKTMIESVHLTATQPAPARPAKLDPIKQAELGGVAHLGAAVALKALGQKPKAVLPTGKTAAPKTRVPPAKGAPRPLPTPAPTEP